MTNGLARLEKDEWNNSDGTAQPLGWLTLGHATTYLSLNASDRAGYWQDNVEIVRRGDTMEYTESLRGSVEVNGRSEVIQFAERMSGVKRLSMPAAVELTRDALGRSGIPTVSSDEVNRGRIPCISFRRFR